MEPLLLLFLKSICRWLSEGCISGQGDHIAKKIYLMHPAAFLLSIYGRASLVLDSVCFNFTVQLLKKSLLALYCESWKAWLWWIRPYVRSLLQASPGSKPHLFDLFLSVFFFFPHQGSLSCICLISARRPAGMLSFPLLGLPLTLSIPHLHTGPQIKLYLEHIRGKLYLHAVWKQECAIKRRTFIRLHVRKSGHENRISRTINNLI